MMWIKRYIYCIIHVGLICLTFIRLSAQNNTSSPYSSIGVGDILPQGIGASQAMGGVGIALRPTTYYNHTNPAANSALLGKAVKIETGVFYNYSIVEDDENTQTVQDFNLNHFTLIFPAHKNYTFSLGLKPYSNIGYDIDLLTAVEGSDSFYQSRFSGEGGLNQVFLGNAYNISPRLAIGLDLSLVWGSVTSIERLFLNGTSGEQLISEVSNSLFGANIDYGIQYSIPLNDEWQMRLGGVLAQPISFGGAYSEQIYRATDQQFISEPEIESLGDIQFPYAFGGGIAVEKNSSWIWGLDIYHEKWSDANLWNNIEELENSTRIAAGMEYTPKQKLIDSRPHNSYRLGLNYTDSYTKIRNTAIRTYGITAGIGIPFKLTGSMNISYEYTLRGTRSNDLILEQNHQISLTFNLPDIWFVKSQID